MWVSSSSSNSSASKWSPVSKFSIQYAIFHIARGISVIIYISCTYIRSTKAMLCSVSVESEQRKRTTLFSLENNETLGDHL